MAIRSKPRLEAGDLVRIKSGGPIMTAALVNHVAQRPFARCAWVDQQGTLRSISIDTAALALVDPNA
jgi:uncharacterized protein YodC (DUF2158 family)